MDIIELTREIGRELQKDERYLCDAQAKAKTATATLFCRI